ncbi:hypothetical protein DNTS_024892 [Danionella cerebrum]|uniref:Cortactin-binding protein-2 N-terminal domain-containing protein n=1 Tax=Danionella cerebrum TaxID=2873325 RepID=A0A553QSU2_9TELE|nr:hypothetical protein DNTS_024892 [Danionella translucida]
MDLRASASVIVTCRVGSYTDMLMACFAVEKCRHREGRGWTLEQTIRRHSSTNMEEATTSAEHAEKLVGTIYMGTWGYLGRTMRSKEHNKTLIICQTSHDVKSVDEDVEKIQENEKSIKINHKDVEEKHNQGDKLPQNDALRDLSEENLLEMLGIMEGELQAREDVICLLRAALLSRPEELESRYGTSRRTRALQALQRDQSLCNNLTEHQRVYEKPLAELDDLRDKHKESYRRMLEQLLLAEKSHRRTIHELDTEKRKHVDYMNKSDDFTNLLEQDRERLKKLLKQEKACQIRKEKEFSKRIQRAAEELVKLKTFALMMVDERELHLEKIDKQSNKIQNLLQKLQENEGKLQEVERKAKEDSQRISDLEVDLDIRTSKFAKEQEEMSLKIANQELQHQELLQKQMELLHNLNELQETNEALQKSTEELQVLKEKIREGEHGNLNLIAELDTLRQTILQSDRKDEEMTRAENKCKELKKMLLDEEIRNEDLIVKLETLQQRITQLEKLEVTFNTGRTECAQLQGALLLEKSLTKDLTDELVSVKIRMKELESSELKLENDELGLKEDLAKLKSLMSVLVRDHKNTEDRARSEEKKKEELGKLYKAEQDKVMEVTERLIEESKNHLKLKSEMELKMDILAEERDALKTKLLQAEEKCGDLSSNGIPTYKAQKVKEIQGNSNGIENNNDNIKKPEIDSNLQQLDMTNRDCDVQLNTKTDFPLQQIQDRSQTIPKTSADQDRTSHRELFLEDVKTQDLRAEIQALKETIHEIMNKEDELSQLQLDYSILQQRFLEEEDRKKSISTECLNLTKELEVTKCYSRTTRPGKGSQMMEVLVTSTGVQTDLLESHTPAAFIKTSIQEENKIMSGFQQRSLKKPVQRPTVRELYPPPVSDFIVKKSWIPWMRKKDCSASEKPFETRIQPDVNVTQKSDHTLHQGVPDTSLSEDLTKQASVKLTHELQDPKTTTIPRKEQPKELTSPDRIRSPLSFVALSRAKKSPSTFRPLSSTSVSSNSSSQESIDMITGRAVYKETPEKRIVPIPIKKSNDNTEDGKLLGTQLHKSTDHSAIIMIKPSSAPLENKEVPSGTVLRSPTSGTASNAKSNKVTRSISMTQVTKAPTRPTLSVQPVTDVSSPRSGVSRIPMSRGKKTGKAMLEALGISSLSKIEPNAENKSVPADLKQPAVGNEAVQDGQT